MLNELEKKINEKILNSKKNIKHLKKEYNTNLNQEILIRNLLENIENIKAAKKKKNLFATISILTAIISVTAMPVSLILFIFGIIAYINEKGVIADNIQEMLNNDYIGSKKEDDLNKNLYKTLYENCILEDKIKENNNRINKYKKLADEIDYVKELKNNVKKYNDDYYKLIKNLYKNVPAIAFESSEEYKNYLSYDNEFIKNEIIESKILSKHL